MGFSAGGQLAAMEATSFDEGKPSANDPVDRLSDRPDFLILGYPWPNAMQPKNRNLITYCSVLPSLPASDCKDWEQKYTPALHVTANTRQPFSTARQMTPLSRFKRALISTPTCESGRARRNAPVSSWCSW
jgi:hypothetical protein